MKMTPEEDAAYMKAFGASKAKTVKERMAEAQAAVDAMRTAAKAPKGAHVGLAKKLKDRPKTIMEAVDKGIEDGSRKPRKK